MTGQTLAEILLLLGLAVLIVTVFQRLGIPSSLGYLLVGVLLGPYTVGPVIDSQHIRVAAELGIVFLLFTIGLNFSLPQIYALRHLVLGLGTGQVLLTTGLYSPSRPPRSSASSSPSRARNRASMAGWRLRCRYSRT